MASYMFLDGPIQYLRTDTPTEARFVMTYITHDTTTDVEETGSFEVTATAANTAAQIQAAIGTAARAAVLANHGITVSANNTMQPAWVRGS